MNNKIPTTIKFSLGLMLAIALIWFLFGLLTVMNQVMSLPVGTVRYVIGFGAIGCSAAIALGAYFLSKRNRPVYYATVALFIMLLVVSFFDELGWTDILLIAATAGTLILLVGNRRWFMGNA